MRAIRAWGSVVRSSVCHVAKKKKKENRASPMEPPVVPGGKLRAGRVASSVT